VVDALDAIGLSPKGACGDVVRNVTGCPLAGVAADELIDASPLAIEIHKCCRQSGVLQPAAQVQDLRHRLPLLVQQSGDQRHRPSRP
jgi:sulfite reductase beta subunit-like hemoprotein